MKSMDLEKFKDRIGAELRARKIFIDSKVTNSISVAFGLYQAVLADRKRELVLETKKHGYRAPTWFDRYERPKCPDCGEDLRFRPVPQNREGVQMQLVCSNPSCDLVLNVDKTLAEFEKELVEKHEPGPVEVSESE
jgi:hypothetical protein